MNPATPPPLTVVPADASEITTEWLSHVLGRPVGPLRVHRFGERHGFASELHRVAGPDGAADLDLVVKTWHTSGPASDREISFYEAFGSTAGIRLPAYHHGAVENGRAVLVIDTVVRARRGDALVTERVESLERIASKLGTLHGRWWANDRLERFGFLRDAAQLRPADWMDERRGEFLDRFGPFESRPARDLFDRSSETVMVAADRLADCPATLIHGDFHTDNVVFDPTGDPIILDWASCSRGPGVIDLAELVFDMTPEPWRERVVGAYLQSVRHEGVDLGRALLIHWLGGALLRMFLIHTFGMARWIPVTDRQRDLQRVSLERTEHMVVEWTRVDPELFTEFG